MQSRPRSFTIGLLCLLVIGLIACGNDDADSPPTPGSEAAAISPAAAPPEPPKPVFDRALLVGEWDTSIEDLQNGMRLDLRAKYQQDGFSIHGKVTMTDPEKQNAPGLKSFDVRGTWTLEGDTLVETAAESTFPLWRVGVSSPATVKTLDDSTFVFERSGATMTFTRI